MSEQSLDAASTAGAGRASSRLLSADLHVEQVSPDGGSELLSTASRQLGHLPRQPAADDPVVGLWEAGPGVDVDVEVDEIFVVLTGRGTVTFDDGSSLTSARASW